MRVQRKATAQACRKLSGSGIDTPLGAIEQAHGRSLSVIAMAGPTPNDPASFKTLKITVFTPIFLIQIKLKGG
jgi:hypothetical protein